MNFKAFARLKADTEEGGQGLALALLFYMIGRTRMGGLTAVQAWG